MSNKKLDKATKELYDLWAKRAKQGYDRTEDLEMRKKLPKVIEQSLLNLDSAEKNLIKHKKLTVWDPGSRERVENELLLANTRQNKLLSLAHLAIK